jgi:uncharacterized protein
MALGHVTRIGQGIVALAAVLFLAFAPALGARAADLRFPELTGRVVDDAHVLSDQQKSELAAELKALEDKNGRQVVVATVSSLQGQTIEDYGYQLGRTWAIGHKGQNDGVVFLIAPNEKKVRIEVGYGLEPVLTDALSSVILQQKVLPRFREGDLAQGVVDGTGAIVEQLGLDDAEARQRVQEASVKRMEAARSAERRHSNPLGGLISIIIIIFVLQAVLRGRGGWFLPFLILSSLRGGRGGGWGDGDGGGWGGGDGGGFSGGGGSFGGGGASGDW